MRVLVWLCIFAGTVVTGNSQTFWQNSFGIVPLHSTRADVERLYGVSTDSCRCNFRTSNAAIHVAFASARCGGPVYGWNVPEDTALEFTVLPGLPIRFSNITPDIKGFVVRYSPDDVSPYYTNAAEGVVFSVQDGFVSGLTYFPPMKESEKRCEGFPPYDGVPPPSPLATVYNRNQTNLESRLDNLASELWTNIHFRGYIVAYAGKKSRRGEAKKMLDTARTYLIRKRMISSDRITAIDGGYRDTAQYELFALSLKIHPPTPTPTVSSKKVQIVGSAARNKQRSK